MKYFLIFVCVILAVFANVKADDCTIDGHTFKVGSTYSKPGECKQYTCTGKNSFSAKICPSAQSLKPCKLIPEDTSKTYPECCPQFEC